MSDGPPISPFDPWLHQPAISQAVLDLAEAVSKLRALLETARQVATIVAGQHPFYLTMDVATVYDAGSPMNTAGILPRRFCNCISMYIN